MIGCQWNIVYVVKLYKYIDIYFMWVFVEWVLEKYDYIYFVFYQLVGNLGIIVYGAIFYVFYFQFGMFQVRIGGVGGDKVYVFLLEQWCVVFDKSYYFCFFVIVGDNCDCYIYESQRLFQYLGIGQVFVLNYL